MIRLILIALALIAPFPALAQHAHSHGEAHLAVVVEGDVLTLLLMADLADLVGFEHEPETDAEKSALLELHHGLREKVPPFVLASSAHCELKSAVTEGGFHPDSEDVRHNHMLTATWEWACEEVSRLRQIETRLFETFPAIAKIDAVILTDQGQTGTTLSAKRNVLKLP